MTRRLGWVAALIVGTATGACSSGGAATTHEMADSGHGSASGSASGSALAGDTAMGTVGGATLTIEGATALVGQTTALLDTTTNVALIGLTSASGATCGTLDGGQAASTTGLTLLIVSKTPIEPISYDIAADTGQAPALPAASAVFSKTNDSCSSIYDGGGPEVTGGNVTVGEISGATIAGTYRVTFADGSLSGSFSAPVCAGVNLNDIFSDTVDAGTPACIQP